MHPIDDQDCSDDLLPNKNTSDNETDDNDDDDGQADDGTKVIDRHIGCQLLSENETSVSIKYISTCNATIISNQINNASRYLYSQLCSSLNLAPTNYLTLKTLYLSGCIDAEDNKTTEERSIQDYLTNVGWLQPLLSTPMF